MIPEAKADDSDPTAADSKEAPLIGGIDIADTEIMWWGGETTSSPGGRTGKGEEKNVTYISGPDAGFSMNITGKPGATLLWRSGTPET